MRDGQVDRVVPKTIPHAHGTADTLAPPRGQDGGGVFR
jgi:hypothetical protein